jgi:hypothetical protein
MRTLYAFAVATLMALPTAENVSGQETWTPQQCANALSLAQDDATFCMQHVWDPYKDYLPAEYESNAKWHCGSDAENVDEKSPEFLRCVEEWKQTHPMPRKIDDLAEYYSLYWGLFNEMKDCVSKFNIKANEIRNACSKVAGSVGDYCGTINALAKSCQPLFGSAGVCGGFWSDPHQTMCERPQGLVKVKLDFLRNKNEGAAVRLDNIGCGDVIPAENRCNEACESDPNFDAEGKAECRAACKTARERKVAICLGLIEQPSESTSAPGSRKTKPASTRRSTVSTRADAAKPASIQKNNLDRFGLGPTYVDTSTSQAGTRTTSRGAAAGVKGTAGTGASTKPTYHPDAAPPPPPPGWSSQGGGIGATVPTPIK